MNGFLDFLEENSNKPEKIIKFLNGKRTVKWRCSGYGYKWNPTIKRCERIEPTTLRKMALGAKKRVRKMKARMGAILRKREKSMKIRLSRMGDN